MELTINVDALDKTQAAVVSATDRTPMAEIELLVVDNIIPLTLRFCDDSGATPSWVTDPTANVEVGLGNQDVDGRQVFSSSTAFPVVGSTREGTLSLNTQALRDALQRQTVCRRGPLQLFILEVRYTTAAGLIQTVALLQAYVAENVLPAEPGSDAGSVAQPANLVYAGPASGPDASPTFRALVSADLPTTAVTPGNYTNPNITVDALGRITAAANGSGGGGGTWGSITGTLSDQTDLQTALNAKLAIGGNITDLFNDAGYITGIAWGQITGTLSSQADLQSALNAKQNSLTIGNLTEATSSVLTITGGTGAIIGSGLTIAVKQASALQAGYLSATDWAAFDAKQPAGSYVTQGAITTSGLTMATARLLGRTTASTGAVEEITVGTGLSLSAGALTSTITQSTGANPAASVGLTAVNGVATTFMRSDGAPALSQTIVPTWTGQHKFQNAVTATPLTIGADLNATTITNGATKVARITSPHYDGSTEENVLLVNFVGGSPASTLSLGGGNGNFNSATAINFYTAANNTTLTGTRRGGFDSAGTFDVAGNAKLTASSSLIWEDSAGVDGIIMLRDSDGMLRMNREIRMFGTLALFGKLGSAGTENFLATDVTGDTNNRLIVTVDGAINWGPGNTATDLTLLRSGVGQMQIGGAVSITGALDAASLATSGRITATVADNSIAILGAGASKGFRIIPNAAGVLFEGVDNTGVGSYQPLSVGGSALDLTLSGTSKAQLRSGGLTLVDAIATGAPSSGSSGAWKLGTYTAGVAVQAGKVRIDIGGTPYDLLTA